MVEVFSWSRGLSLFPSKLLTKKTNAGLFLHFKPLEYGCIATKKYGLSVKKADSSNKMLRSHELRVFDRLFEKVYRLIINVDGQKYLVHV
jgi:hypothetical protein